MSANSIRDLRDHLLLWKLSYVLLDLRPIVFPMHYIWKSSKIRLVARQIFQQNKEFWDPCGWAKHDHTVVHGWFYLWHYRAKMNDKWRLKTTHILLCMKIESTTHWPVFWTHKGSKSNRVSDFRVEFETPSKNELSKQNPR